MPVVAAVLALAALAPAAARAQQPDVRTQLVSRGLPGDLVDQVSAVAADAAAHGLPTAPLADKALEGWAKHVPGPRIVSVLQQFAGRMGEARDIVRGVGVPEPAGEVVSAAAEALGRGMTQVQVGEVVRAGPASAGVAPSLRVASALTAQGMALDQAVLVVTRALQQGRTVDQILDLPSMMRAFQADGMAPPEIGRRMMQGGLGGALPGAPGGPDAGGTGPGRPGGRPPPPPGARNPPPRPPNGMGRGPE